MRTTLKKSLMEGALVSFRGFDDVGKERGKDAEGRNGGRGFFWLPHSVVLLYR